MICLGDSHLVNLEHVLRDSDVHCYIIGEALYIPDAMLRAIEDSYSQINLALIQWGKSNLLLTKTVIDIMWFV